MNEPDNSNKSLTSLEANELGQPASWEEGRPKCYSPALGLQVGLSGVGAAGLTPLYQ